MILKSLIFKFNKMIKTDNQIVQSTLVGILAYVLIVPILYKLIATGTLKITAMITASLLFYQTRDRSKKIEVDLTTKDGWKAVFES